MQDLTTGSITRHLLKTTSFMLVTMLFQTLYVLIDLYWVGRLGKEAVAAVGISGNLTFIVLAITQMLGVGTTTLVSHAVGRKEPARALLVFNQSQVLAIVVGALFLAIAMAIRLPYARALGADDQTTALAADYLLWFIPAMALQFGMVAMGSALRGTGNFKPGMVVQTATVILNMLLAPFLIFGWFTGWALGVRGAALSTFVAIIFGSIWMSTYFLRSSAYLHLVPALWRPRLSLWGQMLKVGLPAGTEFALIAVYMFIVYTVSRPFGAAAQAGFGIGLRIVQAGFLPVVALGFAVAPVAGQNYGARQPDRVRKTFASAAALAGSLMLIFAASCHIAPAAMIRVFSNDPDVVSVGDEYLRIVSWSFIASGIIFVGSSMFQAIGNTIPPLATSIIRLLCVAIPAIMLARLPSFQLRWIWYLAVTAVVIQMVLNVLLLQREMRRRLDVPDTSVTNAARPSATTT
jgi:putative MATE family efflux protein